MPRYLSGVDVNWFTRVRTRKSKKYRVSAKSVLFIICSILAIGVYLIVEIPVNSLASSNQEKGVLDSTPYLTAYPNQLNEQNCQTSNHITWTCVVTLSGQNLTGVSVGWSAYTTNPTISINPSKGEFAIILPPATVTISNIPCMNTFFLFSGQVNGGGAVIPATLPWSCTQPTPIPTLLPTATPIPQPSPTSQAIMPTVTPLVPTPSALTPTITSSPTTKILPSPHSDPPIKGNSKSANVFMISALIFILLEAVVALVLIVLVITRVISKTA